MRTSSRVPGGIEKVVAAAVLMQAAETGGRDGPPPLHQQNPVEIAVLADKAINYLHYTCL